MKMLANIVERLVKAAATYVQITRKEFEDWLDTTKYKSKWKLKDNTAGVYLLSMSDNVAIELSSSIGREDQVLGLGNAAMHMRMVSLITKQTLNKKAQGQSHFKRTTGWRDSLGRGLHAFENAYMQSQAFYDAVAKIADREKYKKEMQAKIEAIVNWESIPDLVRLHQRILANGVFTEREEGQIAHYEKVVNNVIPQQTSIVAPIAPKEMDTVLIEKMRKLWAVAKQANDEWLMKFTESVGQQYKHRGQLSPKQLEVLERGFSKYRVAKELQRIETGSEPF
jgi:hypothetical protein